MKAREEWLEIADKLRFDIDLIYKLTNNYSGDNENYIKYVKNKCETANNLNLKLDEILTSIKNKKGINIKTLIDIIEGYIVILDDIDTAADMFKPKIDDLFKTIEFIHKLKWEYYTINNNGKIEFK
jgi:hypothetical protein